MLYYLIILAYQYTAAPTPAPTTFTVSVWVSATNTVTVRYRIAALVGSEDPASGTFKVTVTK